MDFEVNITKNKPDFTYRIFMMGGSTMLGDGVADSINSNIYQQLITYN